jgi:hypothetical protein
MEERRYFGEQIVETLALVVASLESKSKSVSA